MTVIQWNDRVRRRLRLRDVDILPAVIQTGSMGKAAAALNMVSNERFVGAEPGSPRLYLGSDSRLTRR